MKLIEESPACCSFEDLHYQDYLSFQASILSKPDNKLTVPSKVRHC